MRLHRKQIVSSRRAIQIPAYERRNGMLALAVAVEPRINPDWNLDKRKPKYRSLLELLQAQDHIRLTVERHQGLGAKITGVNGIESLPVDHYFALFVDGIYAQEGVENLRPTKPVFVELEVHKYNYSLR